MAIPKHWPHYTCSDYVQWEGRWELIGSIPVAMSPQPSFRHQRVSQSIAVELERPLEGCEHCRAVLPVDWKISEDTVGQSDNLVVCGEVTTEAYLDRPPVLVFEVLSPSAEQKDRVVKSELYAGQGGSLLLTGGSGAVAGGSNGVGGRRLSPAGDVAGGCLAF